MSISNGLAGIRSLTPEPVVDIGGLKPFASTMDALLRYVTLYRLRSTPRSIPLGVKKTHVGKTDSRGRNAQQEEEFTALLPFFPMSDTEEWYLLTIPLSTNLMRWEQVQLMEQKTGQSWSPHRFERRQLQAFRDLGDRLKEGGMVVIEEKRYKGYAV